MTAAPERKKQQQGCPLQMQFYLGIIVREDSGAVKENLGKKLKGFWRTAKLLK
jgi:hypothetical protein